MRSLSSQISLEKMAEEKSGTVEISSKKVFF